MMRALDSAKLAIHKVPLSRLLPECVCIKVAYAGVNRADLLQRAGKSQRPRSRMNVINEKIEMLQE